MWGAWLPRSYAAICRMPPARSGTWTEAWPSRGCRRAASLARVNRSRGEHTHGRRARVVDDQFPILETIDVLHCPDRIPLRGYGRRDHKAFSIPRRLRPERQDAHLIQGLAAVKLVDERIDLLAASHFDSALHLHLGRGLGDRQ